MKIEITPEMKAWNDDLTFGCNYRKYFEKGAMLLSEAIAKAHAVDKPQVPDIFVGNEIAKPIDIAQTVNDLIKWAKHHEKEHNTDKTMPLSDGGGEG